MKILKFSASWCGPCRVFANTFKKVSEMEEYKDIEFGPVEGKPDLPEQTPVDEQKIAADMQDWRESR